MSRCSGSSSSFSRCFANPRETLRFAGFLLLVALDQARFIIRSRNRRDDSEADEESEKVIALKMAGRRI